MNVVQGGMSLGFLEEILRCAAAGKRSAQGAKYCILSLVDDDGHRGALTIAMNERAIEVSKGRRAPADADHVLIRGSIVAFAQYFLEGSESALSSLELYGNAEVLIQLGELLRQSQSILSYRASHPVAPTKRPRGKR